MKETCKTMTDVGRKQVHYHHHVQCSSKNILQVERQRQHGEACSSQHKEHKTLQQLQLPAQALCLLRVLHGLVWPWNSTAVSPQVITHASQTHLCILLTNPLTVRRPPRYTDVIRILPSNWPFHKMLSLCQIAGTKAI